MVSSLRRVPAKIGTKAASSCVVVETWISKSRGGWSRQQPVRGCRATWSMSQMPAPGMSSFNHWFVFWPLAVCQ